MTDLIHWDEEYIKSKANQAKIVNVFHSNLHSNFSQQQF